MSDLHAILVALTAGAKLWAVCVFWLLAAVTMTLALVGAIKQAHASWTA